MVVAAGVVVAGGLDVEVADVVVVVLGPVAVGRTVVVVVEGAVVVAAPFDVDGGGGALGK